MTMTTWAAFAAAEPDLSARVQQRFAANLHHVLGTIAADGRPRLSGLEVPIRAGHLWLGMMPASAKAADLRRDPRFALHSAPLEEDLADGDAKVDGLAVDVSGDAAALATFTTGTDIDPDALPGGGMALFQADLVRVTLTWVAADQLHVQTWTPQKGSVHRTVG